ncbi:hypothetical protein F5879DRAFT_806983, partial [Lentinula edodes]
MEKLLTSNRNEEDIYGAPDSLISQNNPRIPIANFSLEPVTIGKGQLLGTAHNPISWLDKAERFSADERLTFRQQARVLQALTETNRNESLQDPIEISSTTMVKSTGDLRNSSKLRDDIPGEEYSEPPIEGGPKTAEVVEEFTDSTKLLEELDVCKDLSEEQRETVQEILVKNKEAFGLDGRLGNYPEEIEVPMLPYAKPVALPPIPLSPANREVVDKQIDAWLKLDVIEASKSPWAAPVFIVWRKTKPRL